MASMPLPPSPVEGAAYDSTPDRKNAIALAVLRLTVNDFRSYGYLRLETDGRPVVLTGPNGAGKTNILEALSFLAPGRGLRRTRLAAAARLEAGEGAPWAVAARLEGPFGGMEIGTGREAGSERRTVKIDGHPQKSQAALSQALGVLWLTPSMDRLFQDGASGRRRFLDRLVLGLDPLHGGRAAAYDHAMRERNRLLKEGRYDPAWLDALEDGMAREGAAMTAARQDCIARLNEACGRGIGLFPAAILSLSRPAPVETQDQAAFRAHLAATRRRDQSAGAALAGPHRDDFKVHHAGRDLPAELCSTGEQKALLIAILLGQARIQAASRGNGPLMLLDEVAAHLDEERRGALYDELCALSGQSWLTGTDDALFAAMAGRALHFHVKDAVVSQA